MSVASKEHRDSSKVKSFYSKNLTSKDGSKAHIRNVLRYLDAGNYPSKIARLLGLKKQHVHYYVNKFLELGYIEKVELVKGLPEKGGSKRGNANFYRLTANGKKFLEALERGWFGRVVRLHHLILKFPVLEEGTVPVDWRRVELQNWGQLIGSELGCTVRRNPNSVEVFPEVVEGANPYELLFRAFEQAERVARSLEGKFGMRLGRAEISRKPHFGVYDPVVGEFSEYMEFSDDVGKVDESESYGEIDWYDPEFAKNYLLTFTQLPKEVLDVRHKVEGLEESLSQFSGDMKRIVDSFEKNMQAHLGIIDVFRQESEKRSLALEKLVALRTEDAGRLNVVEKSVALMAKALRRRRVRSKRSVRSKRKPGRWQRFRKKLTRGRK